MITNKTLKDTLDGIKKISKVDLFVYDLKGKIVANTSEADDKISDAVFNFIESKKDKDEKSSLCFYKLATNQVLVAKGKDAKMIGEMTAFQIENLDNHTDSSSDENEFLKKLISNDILPTDLKNQTKQLGVDVKGNKCVFIIESEHEKNGIVIEALKNALVEESDLISDVDDKNIVLVKELVDAKDIEEAASIAYAIVDMLNTEIMQNARVSYSSIITNIKDTANGYNEARIALDVGTIFKTEEQVISYNEIGIEKLIYQMPLSMCKDFIDEVFDGEVPEEFDKETAVTAQEMFENNLNISEAARQLFIHRNTLVYRLDKIYKNTGFDLREFEDAMMFRMVMMVKKYIEYMDDLEK
ncbi:MAG: helix-turn-helix domain-containing protein [Eubacterium sp.]|nr:helix-turn-helix domain-containing protein [Eubacterium sp.]